MMNGEEKKPQRTAQRLAILDFLKDNKSHPSVKDIYEHVSEKLSNISMTTVYNTLELLKLQGQVLELPITIHGEGKRFDSNVTPHDHIICTSCNRVVDIELNINHALLLTEKQQCGFDIKKISINVYGLCPECKSKEKGSELLN
jgi:Fur family transcriptional regulator, peroxide stress response regulator